MVPIYQLCRLFYVSASPCNYHQTSDIPCTNHVHYHCYFIAKLPNCCSDELCDARNVAQAMGRVTLADSALYWALRYRNPYH